MIDIYSNFINELKDIKSLAPKWEFWEENSLNLSKCYSDLIIENLIGVFKKLGVSESSVSVLILGSLKRREITPSSDIDLMVLHDEEINILLIAGNW